MGYQHSEPDRPRTAGLRKLRRQGIGPGPERHSLSDQQCNLTGPCPPHSAEFETWIDQASRSPGAFFVLDSRRRGGQRRKKRAEQRAQRRHAAEALLPWSGWGAGRLGGRLHPARRQW